MSRRWLAGFVVFSLGFGCAQLVRLPAADAAATDGVVDGTLEYSDGGDFKLYYPPGGAAEYLIVAQRKAPSGTIAAAKISYDTGSATISKQDLDSLTIFRIEPLIHWQDKVDFCDPAGPVLCVVPRPPPPPWYLHYRFMSSPPRD